MPHWQRARQTLMALALGSAALPALGGGHYVYIPQFYVIPGQKPTHDEVCVGPEVPVGTTQKSFNGDTMEILSLDGRSKMCGAKDKPILAHVLLTPAADFTSGLRIALPPGFKELQITDRNRFLGERFEAEDAKRAIHVWVKTWRRDRAASFNAWIQKERASQIEGNERTESRTETLDLDGIERGPGGFASVDEQHEFHGALLVCVIPKSGLGVLP